MNDSATRFTELAERAALTSRRDRSSKFLAALDWPKLLTVEHDEPEKHLCPASEPRPGSWNCPIQPGIEGGLY